MNRKIKLYIIFAVFFAAISGTGCNVTKHLGEDEYLLRSNNIEFESDKYLHNRGELTDNLYGSTVQKPNTDFLLPWITPRLWVYNSQYKKYKEDSTNYQIESKTAEPPVIYDSTTIPQSIDYMQAYLFQQGYFYATVDDTTEYKKKKAYVTYNINTGINYLIRRVYFENIQDDEIKKHIQESFGETYLRAGKPYTATLLESERERISNVMRRAGFFYFSNDNISFVLDTADKEYIKEKESAIESVAGLALNRERKRPQLDIYMVVKDNDEGTAFNKYGINKIWVYPDFKGQEDIRDTTMIQREVEGTVFRYHRKYIREKVIFNHTFIKTDTYYDQDNYDKTIVELNRLGVFSTVSIDYYEDTMRGKDNNTHWLNCVILMSPAKKYDYNIDWEVSSGTTYKLGSGITTSLRNKNLANGANLLSFTLSGGIETIYHDTFGNNFFKDFRTLTKTASANVSLEFPKFLFPISKNRYSIRNTPRTEVAVGGSILDRVNYFTLVNLSTRFAYKWRETEKKEWEVTPAFINDISRTSSPEFEKLLDSNTFLQNVYRETFIEGENISWTFSNGEQAKWYDDYSYIKISFEEAGGLVHGINQGLGNDASKYSQYLKLDIDLRHYVQQRHATTALRMYTGIGMPYGESQTLPYIKQYFVGGPYSIRGWQVRTLGPGSYTDSTISDGNSFIDRTGDIKLELNGEYRFDIFKLFGGVLLFEGALFADAGNIWLAKPDQSGKYVGGEFKFDKLYNDFAVSAGSGIRVDIAELFVFRFDLGFPIKRPGTGTAIINGTEQKQGWVFDKIAFGRSDWRSKNLVLNIAIGYPF